MDVNQVWQTVLSQLQTEMPRASFDTWVRDTVPLGYANGELTIGVRNAYARDWIEDRLSNTISRLLIGILDIPNVTLKFVIAEGENDTADREDDENDADGQNQIEEAAATRYQEEVLPHRIVGFSAYALRLLEHGDATHKELSAWIGLRQALYKTWTRDGKPKRFTRNVPHQAILEFACMGRSAFFDLISGVDELAGGMIKKVPDVDQRNTNATRWEVAMEPVLTRRDATVIETILVAEASMHSSRKAKQHAVLEELRSMTRRQPDDFLKLEVKVPAHAPKRVTHIVRRVLGEEGDLPAEMMDAAEGLQDRLMHAFGMVSVSHHFLQVVAPALKLSHQQIWAIITLRDRCVFDYQENVQRDFVYLTNGLQTLADWISVSLKTIERWFEKPEFQLFAQPLNVDRSNAKWQKETPLMLQIRLQEPPLWVTEDGASQTLHWTSPDSLSDKPGLDLDKLGLALDKAGLAFGQPRTQFWTNPDSLNLYNKPLLNPYKPQESSPTTSVRSAQRAAVGNLAFWDFDFLMQNNAVSGASKRKLLETMKSMGRDLPSLSRGFVSWLLYAHSPAGARIQDPVGLAIRCLLDNVHAGAGPDFDHLASLSPRALKRLFDEDFRGGFLEDGPGNVYHAHFSEMPAALKESLYHRLFGSSA